MPVTVQTTSDSITHDRGTYTDIGAQGELLVYDENDVEIAVYHRDHWFWSSVTAEVSS